MKPRNKNRVIGNHVPSNFPEWMEYKKRSVAPYYKEIVLSLGSQLGQKFKVISGVHQNSEYV